MPTVRTIYPVQAALALFTGAFWGGVAVLAGGSGWLILTVGGLTGLAAYTSLLIVTGRVCPPGSDRRNDWPSPDVADERNRKRDQIPAHGVRNGSTPTWSEAGTPG